MRIDIKKTEVFPFDELTEDVQDTVVENMGDINVDYEWWDGTYEDAKNVGIELTEFDLDRGSYCRGEFVDEAEDIAIKIIETHGESCEIYEGAQEFLINLAMEQEQFETEFPDAEEWEFGESSEYDGMVELFKRSILEDYRIMLSEAFNYLISREAIVETIKVNEYEFTGDGRLYR